MHKKLYRSYVTRYDQKMVGIPKMKNSLQFTQKWQISKLR